MAVREPTSEPMTVVKLDVETATVFVVGTSPLYFNRMAEKAKRTLLFPSGRKTQAEREQSTKHNPVEEFRNSVYRNAGTTPSTRLKFPAPAFKGVLKTAALEVPGSKKAQIGRLTWIQGQHVDIYGIPRLKMDVVRSADIGKTPDIRTRAVLETWCCEIEVNYVRPTLNLQLVANLLAAGGLIVGIGDFRQEKGAGSNGQYRLASENDPDLERIKATGGREDQDAALETAEPYDEETAELVAWWQEEFARRGQAAESKVAKARARKKEEK